MNGNFICKSPEDTFKLGETISGSLGAGDVVLLTGGLGAGKTLLTKGILNGLDYDIDEVTSPSFALVNLYKTERFDVYHIDLWRIDGRGDAAFAVGLDDILENEKTVVIIEWADRLKFDRFRSRVFNISFDGEGDDPRKIVVEVGEQGKVDAVE